MLSVGIFVVAAALQNIMKIDEEMRKNCSITYLPYTGKENLITVYKENIGRFDAVLFGGSYTYEVVKEATGEIPCPFAFLKIYDRDYYRVIARLAVNNKNLDFSRVFLDAPEFPVDLQAIFKENNMPVIGGENKDISYSEYWEWSYERYIRMWKSGKIDHIITRFGSMTDYLTEAGISFSLLHPSRESMLDTFYGLLVKTREAIPSQGTACICILSLFKDDRKNLDELYNRVCALGRQLGDIFLTYKHDDQLEFTVNAEMIQQLSGQFTKCPILNYLRSYIDFPFAVGWGLSNDILQAHRNAAIALREAKKHERTSSFLVTKDNYIVGPLEGIDALPDTFRHAPTLEAHDKSTSNKHIEKIRELAASKKEPILSAAELAESLGITVRSAARILLKLQEMEAAMPMNRRKSEQVGRPVKYYYINLAKL